MSRRQRTFIGPSGMGGLVSLWGANSIIRSVQYGTITLTTSGTSTIIAVDTSSSIAVYLGETTTDTTTNTDRIESHVALTNATTVTASNADSNATKIVGYCVIEFAPGLVKRLQTGNIQILASSSNTATISEVQTAKAWMVWAGQITSATNQNDYSHARVTLTNATTVTATAGANTGGNYIRLQYIVVEMF